MGTEISYGVGPLAVQVPCLWEMGSRLVRVEVVDDCKRRVGQGGNLASHVAVERLGRVGGAVEAVERSLVGAGSHDARHVRNVSGLVHLHEAVVEEVTVNVGAEPAGAAVEILQGHLAETLQAISSTVAARLGRQAVVLLLSLLDLTHGDPATRLDDPAVEEGASQPALVGSQKQGHGASTGADAVDRHAARVSAELGDVLLDPLQALDHVLDSSIGAAVCGRFLAEKEAGHTNTVVLGLKSARRIRISGLDVQLTNCTETISASVTTSLAL